MRFLLGDLDGRFSLKVLMMRQLCSRRVVATHRRQVVMPLTEELKGTNADASKNEDLLQGRGEQLPISLGLLLQR